MEVNIQFSQAVSVNLQPQQFHNKIAFQAFLAAKYPQSNPSPKSSISAQNGKDYLLFVYNSQKVSDAHCFYFRHSWELHRFTGGS